MKKTIKHRLFTEYFNRTYDVIKSSDEIEDYIYEFDNMKKMITDEESLYENYISTFSLYRLKNVIKFIS